MTLRLLHRLLALAAGAAIAVGVAVGADSPGAAPAPTTGPAPIALPSAAPSPVGVDPLAAQATRLGAAHGCSPYGLPDGVVPQHAVIRVGDDVRLVSFDRGWAAYLGEAPGTLVSVCAG